MPDEDLPHWLGECNFIEKGILPAQVREMSLADRRNLAMYFKAKNKASEEKAAKDKWPRSRGVYE